MARLEALDPAAELPTIWSIPDDFWEQFIVPLLREHDPEPHTGRPRIDPRKALDGILFIARSGCQWNALPREFGNDSSVHRTYQRWVKLGLFEKLWAALAGYARKLGLVQWEWQSSDTASGKARFGGTMSGRTPRIVRKTASSGAC